MSLSPARVSFLETYKLAGAASFTTLPWSGILVHTVCARLRENFGCECAHALNACFYSLVWAL